VCVRACVRACVKIVLLLVSTSATCALGCGLWEAMIGYHFQAYLPWEEFVPGSVQASGNDTAFQFAGPIVLALLNFVAYIILLSSVIPISLYVRYVDPRPVCFSYTSFLLIYANLCMRLRSGGHRSQKWRWLVWLFCIFPARKIIFSWISIFKLQHSVWRCGICDFVLSVLNSQ